MIIAQNRTKKKESERERATLPAPTHAVKKGGSACHPQVTNEDKRKRKEDKTKTKAGSNQTSAQSALVVVVLVDAVAHGSF